jgi:hypothetical protein
MANTFKLKTFDGSNTASNSPMSVYTAPASTSTVIVGLTISNTTQFLVFINVKINNVDGDEVFLVKGAPVPQGGSIEIMNGNKIVLESGDSVVVYSNTANSVDTIVSVMEQS